MSHVTVCILWHMGIFRHALDLMISGSSHQKNPKGHADCWVHFDMAGERGERSMWLAQLQWACLLKFIGQVDVKVNEMAEVL